MAQSLKQLACEALPVLSLESGDEAWECTLQRSAVCRLLNSIQPKAENSLLSRLGSGLQIGAFACVLALMVALGMPQFANDKEGLAAFVAGAALFRLVGWAMHGKERFQSRTIDMLVLCFLAANVIATAASHYLEPSIRGLAKVVVYIISYFVFSVALQQSRRRILITLGCLLATGFVVALYGLYQYKIGVAPLATWEDPTIEDKGTRIFSTLGNPNLLAAYLIPLIPLSVSLALLSGAKRWWFSFSLLGVAAVLTLATVLTGSRGGWIGLGGAALAYLAVASLWLFKSKHRAIAVSLWALPIAGFLALQLKPSFHQRFMSMFAGWEHSSNAFRLNVWIASWRMFTDNWWFGVGPGNKTFVLAYGLYMRSGFDALGTYCVPLELGVESGILGILAFTALLVAVLARAHLAFWQPADEFKRWLSLGCASALIGLMAQGLVDTVFFRPQVQLIFWLIVSLIVCLRSRPAPSAIA